MHPEKKEEKIYYSSIHLCKILLERFSFQGVFFAVPHIFHAKKCALLQRIHVVYKFELGDVYVYSAAMLDRL